MIALYALPLHVALPTSITLGTAAWQLASALAPGTGEQTTVGAVLSLTVKVVVQLALLPAASVAVTVIVCVPRPSIVPAVGDRLKMIALGARSEERRVGTQSTLGSAA